MKLLLKAFVKTAEKDRVQTLREFFERDIRFFVTYPQSEEEEEEGEEEDWVEEYTAFTVWVYKGIGSGIRINVDNSGQIIFIKTWKEKESLLGSQLEVLIKELCKEVNLGNLSKLPELGETLIVRALLKESTS